MISAASSCATNAAVMDETAQTLPLLGSRRVVQPLGDVGVTLEDAAAEGFQSLPAEVGHVAQRDPVGRHQVTSSADEFHRQRVRVLGPEDLESPSKRGESVTSSAAG